jgi:hypothetical protein
MPRTIPKDRLSTTILQILPAQPGTAAVWCETAESDDLEEGQPLYYAAPIICWALVEYAERYANGFEETRRAVVGMTNETDRFSLDLLDEEDGNSYGDAFLGYSLPGQETDWQATAATKRELLGIE